MDSSGHRILENKRESAIFLIEAPAARLPAAAAV